MKVLDHPNILKLVDYFDERNHFHIVTEICRGGDLFDLGQQNRIWMLARMNVYHNNECITGFSKISPQQKYCT